MIEAGWGTWPTLSVGAEEELMILDATTYAQVGEVETLIGSLDGDVLPGVVKTELFAQPPELRKRGLRVRHDRRGQLGEAFEQLRLEALRRRGDHAGEGGRRLERGSVDEDHLLLDAERPRWSYAEPMLHDLPRIPCTGLPAASHA